MENDDYKRKHMHLFNSLCLPADSYMELHAEITSAAFVLTGETESAKDLASECLLACWEQVTNEEVVSPQVVRQTAFRLIDALYQKLSKYNLLCQHAVSMYWQQRNELDTVQHSDVQARYEALMTLSRRLEPIEQQIIIWNLVYQWALEEIALRLEKPVSAVKNIRNRAVLYLKHFVAEQR